MQGLSYHFLYGILHFITGITRVSAHLFLTKFSFNLFDGLERLRQPRLFQPLRPRNSATVRSCLRQPFERYSRLVAYSQIYTRDICSGVFPAELRHESRGSYRLAHTSRLTERSLANEILTPHLTLLPCAICRLRIGFEPDEFPCVRAKRDSALIPQAAQTAPRKVS